jgi:WD40 repeat protein
MPPDTWDDCLLRLDFQKGRATSVCDGEYFFAIGLSSGLISLYETGSAQLLRRMTHPEAVRILQFSQDDKYLVSCGPKRLFVWDPKSGAMTRSFFMKSAPLAVSFLDGDGLLYASQSSETTHLYVVNPKLLSATSIWNANQQQESRDR